MFKNYFKDNVLFVVPNDIKEQILKELSKQKEIYRISFLSLEEFKKHYFFEIQENESLSFLSSKSSENFSVLQEKIKLLSSIPITKKYKNKKLKDLASLYQLLEKNNFVIQDKTFLEYLKNFEIYCFGYPVLEPFEEEMLKKCKAKVLSLKEQFTYPHVHHFSTKEEEIFFVGSQMKSLHQKGIPYQNMVLSGVLEDDVYLIQQIFSKLNIPIMGLIHPNLYATVLGKSYYQNKNAIEMMDISIATKLATIENQLLKIPQDSPVYSYLLKEALKNTTIDLPFYEDAVRVVDFYHLFEEEDIYSFVIGFNQNQIPQVLKDENYLSDKDIEELALLTTKEKNKNYKEVTLSILKSLSNLTVSYCDKTLSNTLYPSFLIQEYGLEVVEEDEQSYQYSKSYSLIRLGEMLDQYFMYGVKHKDLNQLSLSFSKKVYRTYQHQYQKVPFYLSQEQPYYLSYSSLNDYALCKFRYYAKYILKVEEQKEVFATVLGNIYHQVLMHIYDASFDFDEEWDKAISNFTLSQKEKVLLKRLKKELQFIIPVIEEQDSKSAYQARLFEQKLEVPLGDNVFLKGFIDKIAFCELYGKIHYVIYDYKTGSVTLDLTHIDDGLFLQLPLYQVLVEKGNLFSKPSFTGFFYQQLLLPSKNQKEKLASLRLRGYAIDDEEALSIFDETYENSEVIKSLKMTSNGFSKNSKVLSSTESQEIKEKTWKKVLQMKREILSGDFTINPKRLKGKNISCMYCPFSDICYHDERDFIEIQDKEATEEIEGVVE